MQSTLPIRMTELGRIRIGDQVPIQGGRNEGKPRPNKLTQFRITGNNPIIMQEIADLYGGNVVPWEVRPAWQSMKGVRQPTHKFELYTETASLDVIIPALSEISSWREIWDAGGCAHRCDPATREIVLDDDERAIGETCLREDCEEVSRVNVMLAGIKAFGVWRLDTKGYYASSEIRGFLTWLELCGIRFAIKATLNLEERQTKSHKKGTLNFVVPVFQPDYTPDQLMLMAGQAPAVPPRQLSIPTDAENAANIIAMFGPEREARTSGHAETAETHEDGPGEEAEIGASTFWHIDEALAAIANFCAAHDAWTPSKVFIQLRPAYPEAADLAHVPADALMAWLDAQEA